MKKFILISSLLLIGCAQNQQAHPPVGGILSEKDLNTSKNRAKNLNQTERAQIQDWIKSQQEKFYPMSLNYWVNIDNLQQNQRKNDGDSISYEYEIYDFDLVKLYDQPKKNSNVQFGRFEELKAVEDALRYLNKNQEATLLVPSVLGFGTYGDNDKIPNDMPLIIKIKVL
ncbi:FKBP-type peptidyl-prolyl cis-trans isomerase [Kaistella faecalis]|uniref:FKBP-type peptidyl-prolyl cis-trans isomerase n=1 Tax=Kaistella faecalis TaxID=2852098 RepID=UPI001C496F72|nr:FKBP-type peptidyl-prolyl cis-trans isomerase [Chryseobacterium faecale]UFK97947.1 FKBP-type peptidyl-prolyl cis-trans isomerase [Chryseobacterium faecale]